MTMGPVFPPDYNPQPDSDRFIKLLWEHIRSGLTTVISGHHASHEISGADRVRMKVRDLYDTYIVTPEVGDVLTYTGAGSYPWRNQAVSSVGQAFFEAAGTVSTGTYPGPKNLQGVALTIGTIVATSDGGITASMSPGGAIFLPGGGGESVMAGSFNWAAGSRLSLSVTAAGSATYLAIDVVFTR